MGNDRVPRKQETNDEHEEGPGEEDARQEGDEVHPRRRRLDHRSQRDREPHRAAVGERRRRDPREELRRREMSDKKAIPAKKTLSKKAMKTTRGCGGLIVDRSGVMCPELQSDDARKAGTDQQTF